MRTLTEAMAEELDRTVKRPALFFEAEFEGGWVRIWTGDRDLELGGETWVSARRLAGAGVSEVIETGDVEARGIEVTLSGVPLDMIEIAIAEVRQGLPGRLFLGFVDDEGEVIADPALAFAGRLDVADIEDDGRIATITISYESRLVDLERARERRYTHEDQQIDYPGDLGFQYVAAIQEWNGKWGRT